MSIMMYKGHVHINCHILLLKNFFYMYTIRDSRVFYFFVLYALRLINTDTLHTHFVPGVVRDVKIISLTIIRYHSAIYAHIKMSIFKKIRIVKKKKYFIV